VGQFEGEGLDFEFGGVQGRVAQRDGLPGQRQFGVEPVEFLRGQNRPARQEMGSAVSVRAANSCGHYTTDNSLKPA